MILVISSAIIVVFVFGFFLVLKPLILYTFRGNFFFKWYPGGFFCVPLHIDTETIFHLDCPLCEPQMMNFGQEPCPITIRTSELTGKHFIYVSRSFYILLKNLKNWNMVHMRCEKKKN